MLAAKLPFFNAASQGSEERARLVVPGSLRPAVLPQAK